MTNGGTDLPAVTYALVPFDSFIPLASTGVTRCRYQSRSPSSFIASKRVTRYAVHAAASDGRCSNILTTSSSTLRSEGDLAVTLSSCRCNLSIMSVPAIRTVRRSPRRIISARSRSHCRSNRFVAFAAVDARPGRFSRYLTTRSSAMQFLSASDTLRFFLTSIVRACSLGGRQQRPGPSPSRGRGGKRCRSSSFLVMKSGAYSDAITPQA
jgi:hypothetical protein